MEHRYPHRHQHYIRLFVKWSNLCTKGDGGAVPHVGIGKSTSLPIQYTLCRN